MLIELDDGDLHPMACDGDGWWRIDLPPAGRYRYVVDGFAVSNDDGLFPRDVQVDEDTRCVVVQCDRLTWAANFSHDDHLVDTQVAMGDLVLTNDAAIRVDHGQISLPAQSVAIFRST